MTDKKDKIRRFIPKSKRMLFSTFEVGEEIEIRRTGRKQITTNEVVGVDN
ncbi:hypothetical protein LCGC14_1086680 [marine sediment metagenome]|uniref:Uncharacterized protein n=1 Tax=marine sediment metagenome TaxID=412755 RepID=A0A0F9N178_9ZZZZ